MLIQHPYILCGFELCVILCVQLCFVLVLCINVLRFDPPVLRIMTCTVSIACLRHSQGHVHYLFFIGLSWIYNISYMFIKHTVYVITYPNLSPWHHLKHQLARLLGPGVIRGPKDPDRKPWGCPEKARSSPGNGNGDATGIGKHSPRFVPIVETWLFIRHRLLFALTCWLWAVGH